MAGTSNPWDDRYAFDGYLFGEAPNAFLASQVHRLKPGWRALAVADGERRNGVWLAEQSLLVESIDGSAVAQAKARRLADARSVAMDLTLADLSLWEWPERQFDVVVAIFIQFAPPMLRTELFAGMVKALKPEGLLMLQGYRPEQLQYGTGGPSSIENLYTVALLRDAFPSLELLALTAHDAVIHEGIHRHF